MHCTGQKVLQLSAATTAYTTKWTYKFMQISIIIHQNLLYVDEKVNKITFAWTIFWCWFVFREQQSSLVFDPNQISCYLINLVTIKLFIQIEASQSYLQQVRYLTFIAFS